MKRIVFCIILAAVLCVAAAAFAADLTWNQVCTQKTSAGTQLYAEIEGQLVPSTFLPAGTYIRTAGGSKDGKTYIAYSMDNANPLYGYIDGSVIVSAVTSYRLPDGRVVSVPEACVRSRAALAIYLDVEYGITLQGSTYIDGDGVEHDIGNESILEDPNASLGDAKWGAAIGWAYANNGTTRTFLTDDEGNQTEVQVRYMGLARSMVLLNGEKQLVETWRLSWETEAPESKVLAIIDPEKVSGQGEASLRAKDSKKSTILNKVETNRVVRVIKTGKNWTLVEIDDPETPRGYVLTDVLSFFPNQPMAYTSGVVSAAGKTNGHDPVTVYAEDHQGARRLKTQFDLGHPLSIYCQSSEGWSEVDVGGYHAFILSKYVTLDSQLGAE